MKEDKRFVVIFFSLVFVVLGWIIIKQGLVMVGVSSMSALDNWQYFEAKKENNIIDKFENFFNSKRIAIENRVNSNFPFYMQSNSIYQGFNISTNGIIYENIPIKTNSDSEYLFYDAENEFYYLENRFSKNELDERLNKQIDFFNNLDMELYIYIPTRYELTTLKENNLYSYIDTFKDKVNSNILVGNMDIKTIDEYKSKFYRTDHHWNINGALDGYRTIMEMLGEESIEVEVTSYDEPKYYGSMAKSAVSDIISDNILDINNQFDYEVLINGESNVELFKPRKITKRDNIYHDYYVQYFNGQYGEVVYDYKQNDKDNLLIMSDSYAWQIDYLIAASFNKTYVLNLRYDEFAKGILDIKEYMESNDIDKVLFLYEGGSILFDQYDYDFAGKVK